MKMRGILIDPFTKTVTDVETSGKLAEIYEILGVELITAVSVGEDQTLFLDDEGLMVPKDNQEYFQWRGSNQPYAGKGLILGVDEDGDNIDASMGSLDAAMLVEFLEKANIDPEAFLGFSVYTW
jgi:hypothetical protein